MRSSSLALLLSFALPSLSAPINGQSLGSLDIPVYPSALHQPHSSHPITARGIGRSKPKTQYVPTNEAQSSEDPEGAEEISEEHLQTAAQQLEFELLDRAYEVVLRKQRKNLVNEYEVIEAKYADKEQDAFKRKQELVEELSKVKQLASSEKWSNDKLVSVLAIFKLGMADIDEELKPVYAARAAERREIDQQHLEWKKKLVARFKELTTAILEGKQVDYDFDTIPWAAAEKV